MSSWRGARIKTPPPERAMYSDSEEAFRPSADSSDEDVRPVALKRPAAIQYRHPAKELKTSKEHDLPEVFSDPASISEFYVVTRLAMSDKTPNWERWLAIRNQLKILETVLPNTIYDSSVIVPICRVPNLNSRSSLPTSK
jgi:hypothetical protein